MKTQTYIKKRRLAEKLIPKIGLRMMYENSTRIIDITTDVSNYFFICLTIKGEIVVFDIRTFQKIATIASNKTEKIISFVLSSDSAILAVSFLGGINKFYDFKTGKLIATTDLGEGFSCTKVVFSPCNAYMLCYYENDIILLFNRNDLLIPIKQYEISCVNSLSFSSGGDLFCLCTDNGILRIHSISYDNKIKYRDKKEKFGSLIFEADNPHYLIGTSKKHGILTKWIIKSNLISSCAEIKIPNHIVGYSLSSEKNIIYIVSSYMGYAYDWTENFNCISQLDFSYTGIHVIGIQSHITIPHIALIVGKYSLGIWNIITHEYNEFYIVHPEMPLVSFAFWSDVTKVVCLLSDGKLLLFTSDSSIPKIAQTCENKGWPERIKDACQYVKEPYIENLKEMERMMFAPKN